uniref:Cilia- and flagella-associated protein 77 n=1 Tax=Pyxicephalus adspersus TaxID=30357 RepID=A0AAV2ZSM1_PYXAD|nr:TPA: hypothetical protein GDO54_018082 [Pyxicephalus adspersus]
MENERFGLVRESMNNNQLLQKAELGKTKRMCYTLPGPDFTYGQKSFLKEGGVASAIGHWETVEAKARHRKLESNFVDLNCEAVKSGLVTAAEHQTFRNTHKIWCPINEGRVKDHRQCIPPGMTFGISTRPSTPIFELIEHRFQNLWLVQQRQASEALRIRSKEKVGSHLDTFPSEKARQGAFSAHHSDAIARRGLHGQGIYNIC